MRMGMMMMRMMVPAAGKVTLTVPGKKELLPGLRVLLSPPPKFPSAILGLTGFPRSIFGPISFFPLPPPSEGKKEWACHKD